MRREREDREHRKDARQNYGPRIPDGHRVLIQPIDSYPTAEPRRSMRRISDAEIAQLVSVALEDTIAALNEPVPEIYIRLRACEARAGIREMLSTFPGGRPKDPKTIMEYRRAIMFQNVALELALNMVASIRRCSKVHERDIPTKFL